MSQSNATIAPADARLPPSLKILFNFVATRDDGWKGSIFNRENGETFDCLMSLVESGQLNLHAYKGAPALGRAQYWNYAAAGNAK